MLATAFARNPRLIVLTIALLLVSGLVALTALPRTEDPRVLNRVAFILTPYPGASAERVEALVSEPIEEEMRKMPEISNIWSTSRPGLSVVTLELKDTITETVEIWSRARDHLADIQTALPAEALPSRFDDDRGYAYTIQFALTWRGPGELDLGVLSRYARELESQLRGVPGTDLVRTYGAPEEEISVVLSPSRATSVRLSPTELADAIRSSDPKVPAGVVRNGSNNLQVEVAGELNSLERIRSIPVRVNSDGETIKVGDVAEVRRDIRTPPSELALTNNQRAIVVAARMLPNLRVDRWLQTVRDTAQDYSTVLSANVELNTIFDQGGYTEQRLTDLAGNVLLGFVLILAVLLLTLGFRSALIVALALPLTALFTLICLRVIGMPIHQMSVTGLIVALGIMVDNAIVMVDYIKQERARGLGRFAAVSSSVRHLWLPLAGSTLTTILAFSPIVLMPGAAGEFVGGIAVSVIFALFGSYWISHTIIAGLAGLLVKDEVPESGALERGIAVPKLGKWFDSTLAGVLRHPVKAVLVLTLLPLAGFWGATQLTEQFFPPSDRDMFAVEVHLAPQASVDASAAAVGEVQSILAQYDEITDQHWFIGSAAPPFYYNLVDRFDGAANFSQAMIKVTDFRAANRLIPELQTRLDDAFPTHQILVRKLEQGPPFNAPVEIRVFGPNLEQLKELGNDIRRVMTETANVTHTRATLGEAQPKALIKTREEVTYSSSLGLTDIAGQMQASLEGVVRGSVLEGTQDVPVRVRLDTEDRKSIDDLLDMYIATSAQTASGDHNGVPLSALATLELVPARGVIPRRNGQRVNTIEGFLRAGVLPATALAEVQQNLAASGFQLPAGYKLEIGGESAKRDDAVGNLLSSVGIIVVLLIAVLVLSFNSFRLSAVIITVAAQSAGLGLLSVYLAGYPFGFTVIVGLLGLMGLAINAAIVIIAELKADPAAARGELQPMIKAVGHTTRHIVSTTITTVGGFLPLILAGGGFWPPFAIAIAGGTVLTTTLSFFFVPALFRLFAKHRAFGPKNRPSYFRHKKHKALAGESTAETDTLIPAKAG